MGTNIDEFLDDFLKEDLGNIDELKKKKDKFEPKKSRIPLPSFNNSNKKENKVNEKLDKNELKNGGETKGTNNGDSEDSEEGSKQAEEVPKQAQADSKDINNGDSGDSEEEQNLEVSEVSKQAQAILDWEPPAPRSTPEILENEWITTGWIGFLHVDQILTEAIITGASDVHLTTDQKVAMSRNGDIVKYDGYVIPDNETMHSLIHEGILSHQEQAEFNRDYEYDGSYTLQYGPYKGSRTRISIGRGFGKYFIVCR